MPAEEEAKDRETMRDIGNTDAFLNRVFIASPDEMWFPSHTELLEAGVLTD